MDRSWGGVGGESEGREGRLLVLVQSALDLVPSLPHLAGQLTFPVPPVK